MNEVEQYWLDQTDPSDDYWQWLDVKEEEWLERVTLSGINGNNTDK